MGLGKKGGRKPLLTIEQVKAAMARIQAGEKSADVAADYGVTRQNIYKRARDLRENLD